MDESHRLFRCKNIQNYTRFRNKNESFGLDRDNATQLDWVLKQSAYTVLFYDENQSIKGSDITYDQFNATIRNSGKNLKQFELSSQIRCKGGDDYVAYLKKIMECNDELKFRDISNYRFLLYDDVDAMVRKIRELDDNEGLCRTVAGFSWEWRTRPNHIDDNTYQNLVNEGRYDIAIGDYHYIWNLSQDDWMGQTDSKYTIGCIHTVQGFDLNYVGIIFGREIDYDPNRKSLVIDLDMFCDRYVKQNVDTNIVKDYILNTYMTMMTRGIKGCFVYAYNENLRNYLKSLIRAAQKPDDYPSK